MHLYFYVATSLTDSAIALAISKAVSQNKVKAFNMSFGECEVLPYSGAPGAAFPASSPYVIAVGGTNLFTNADYTFDFETGWEAGGGGISLFETAPFWQSYAGGGSTPIVPGAAGGDRGLPDVSMCVGGSELAICAANIIVAGASTLVGGTSLSSPLAMGSRARIQSAHRNRLGFAGPLL